MSVHPFYSNYPPTVRAVCIYRTGDLRWRVQGRKIPFIAENAAPCFRFKITLASSILLIQLHPEVWLVFPILGDDGYLLENLRASRYASMRAL